METTNIPELVAGTFVPMLETLSTLLDKGAASAAAEEIDLVNARLAPDMHTLAQQVQIACYFAADVHQRLAGGAPLSSAADGVVGDPESSVQGMKAQIARTLDRAREVTTRAFDGAGERDCSIEIPGTDMVIEMDGWQFLLRWAIPNFYFHVVTAYDILRHLGVQIGKQDYLTSLTPLVRKKR